jgi:hypothetical protein
MIVEVVSTTPDCPACDVVVSSSACAEETLTDVDVRSSSVPLDGAGSVCGDGVGCCVGLRKNRIRKIRLRAQLSYCEDKVV